MDEEKTYEVEVYCDNCGWKGKLRFPKGQEIKNFLSLFSEYFKNRICPNCQCYKLRKSGSTDYY